MTLVLVITADRRASRASQVDAVPDILADLSDVGPLERAFMRTVGDEVQGVLPASTGGLLTALPEALDRLTRERDWWLGLGIGAARLGADAVSSSGPAFYAAREAVELAKSADLTGAVSLRVGLGDDAGRASAEFDRATELELAEALERVGGLGDEQATLWSAWEAARIALGRHAELLRGRSPQGREAVARARRGGTREEMGHDLGISRQAVDKRLAAAGWPRAEHESRHLLGLTMLALARALRAA